MSKILVKPKKEVGEKELKYAVGGRGMRCFSGVKTISDGNFEITLTPDAPVLHICELLEGSGVVEWAKEIND